MYREVAPPRDMAAHVACLWTGEARGGAVLPDGCADLVWTGDGLVVAGPATGAVAPHIARGTPVFGVRLRLRAAERVDPLARAAALGLAAPGARVSALGDHLGISERQLRRRFAEAVGYGPKTLARILRFQRFLALAGGGDELAGLAFAAGYADQAHLTRECVRLSGRTPAALLAAGAGPAGEPGLA